MSVPHCLPILLVDDEEEILFTTAVTLRSAGFAGVATESDSRRVMETLAREEVALILLDLYMPHRPGYELLKEITAAHPHIPVIVVTAANEVGMAVECMREGAFDYLVKPVEEPRLLSSIRRAMEVSSLRSQVASLRERILTDRLEHEEIFAPIITRNPRMRAIFSYLEAVAPSPQPVLVCGETGTGKELVARAIHRLSGRKGDFVAVNIAGLDDLVFSDTLFGHRRGAFTGADRDRDGLLARAAGGTIFLDEIGDLGLSSQVKLLRLLQEREFYPLGADSPRASDARVVVATNRDLHRMIAENSFRRDLFYRLSAHAVTIPPLRERKEDLPLLVDHFLGEAAASLGKRKPTPPRELCAYLSTHDFPGNVRELQAMVFDAVTRHDGRMLSVDSFREAMRSWRPPQPPAPRGVLRGLAAGVSPEERVPTLKEAEETLIALALERSRGNQGIAATYLGISRQALNKRLSRREDAF